MSVQVFAIKSCCTSPCLPSYCCATVSHKKRVRWSAKNPLLAQSRRGNKVETGEGEEREETKQAAAQRGRSSDMG
ncbi:hypothetical protein QR685DRAFT_514847 [Neurospora intermedia]|uniref:Uncharacterized protein n=1 Tax=Neurospora intermedia TaxID=5142 RepID=A0ABR3DUD8_NEUIN